MNAYPQHRGTIVPDLGKLVEEVEQKVLPQNPRIEFCLICGRPEKEHSHVDGACPSPQATGSLFLESKFTRKCRATVTNGTWDPNGWECGRLTTGEFCEEHQPRD